MEKRIFLVILPCFLLWQANGQTIIFNQYLAFNGADVSINGNFIDIADDPSLNFNAATGFTVQFWLNPINLQTANGTLQGLVTKKTKTGLGYGVFWRVNSTGGRIQIALNSGFSRTISSHYITGINSIGWVHITMVVERNSAPAEDTAYLYFNGSLEVKDNIPTIGDVSNTRPMRLMNYALNTSDFCAGGRLDEVRIWNVALTEKQIQRLYNEPIESIGGVVHGKISGRKTALLWNNLVGYWDMEDPLGGVAITDKSNHTNHGVFYEGSSGIACGPAPTTCGPSLEPGAIGVSPSTFVATATGNWSDAATWGGAGVPNASRDIIFIDDGVTVTLDGNFECEDVTIKTGGTLISQSGPALSVNKFFDVDGTFNSNFGTIRFTGRGDHQIYGESNTIEFFNFEMAQSNSQIQVNSPIRINGILYHTNGRIRTEDNITLAGNTGNPSLPYAMIDPSGNPDIVGLILMEKELSNTNTGWRQICMPLAGVVNGVNMGFNGLPLNTTGSANAAIPNVFYWDNNSDVGGVPANNVGWTQSNDNDDETKPLTVFLKNPSFPFTTSFSFTGTYNPGDHNYPITYYNDPNNPVANGQPGYENGVGWNFIPNPYPSLLVGNAMLAGNPLAYKNIHFWDANTQQYKAFASVSSSIIPYGNTGQSASSGFASLQPFQGFWVKTSSLAESGINFTVQNSWRRTNYAFAPHPSLKQDVDAVLLNVYADADSTWDGVSIVFDKTASLGFENDKDVYKLFSPSNVPALYLEADKKWLMVSCVPASTQRVRVFFKPQHNPQSALYHINLNTKHLGTTKTILLEDVATGSLHDFKNGDYTFSANEPVAANRFVLHFFNSKTPYYGVNQLENISAYVTKENIVLQSAGLLGPATLTLSDVTGRVLYSTVSELGRDVILQAPSITGMVLLHVSSGLGTRTIKLNLAR